MSPTELDLKPVVLFYSYSHKDEALRRELEEHLSLLRRQGFIHDWHDRKISAGREWEGAIDANLEAANVIVLLVSSAFLASDYCYDREMKRALEKHEAGEARVIPVILRAVDWKGAPFGKLQALPKDAKPITSWTDRDEAWTDVVKGIRKAVEEAVKELREEPLAARSTTGETWQAPPRNRLFTGREDILKQLHDRLTSGGAAALSGLGGTGKTQIAAEYAHRHRDKYKTVLWTGGESPEALVSGFVAIAETLNLPEKDAQDQTLAVSAVKQWLERTAGWLLVLDNADDLVTVREFIPSGGKGHVLLTTCAQATGPIAQRIDIGGFEPEEGVLFLLRRAKIIAKDVPLDRAPEADRALAGEISKEMYGLPLALDQAGAYIEETGCGVSDYLGIYRSHSAQLLKRRGELASDHPIPVAATLALSFEKVENARPAAAELLRFCAFVHPDGIPEEIIVKGAPKLGPLLESVASSAFDFNAAIAETLKYSLLRRDSTAKTLNIHHLVQSVLKDGMDEATQRQWAVRAVRAVEYVFPNVEVSEWQRCERLLPHAQTCAELVEKWGLEFPEATRLLNQAGFY